MGNTTLLAWLQLIVQLATTALLVQPNLILVQLDSSVRLQVSISSTIHALQERTVQLKNSQLKADVLLALQAHTAS